MDLTVFAKYQMPTVCPLCGSALELTPKHTKLFCPNSSCSSHIQGRINKWTNQLKIKEFGEQTIATLVNILNVASVSELYEPSLYERLSQLPGFGECSANKAFKNIQNAKNVTLADFIGGFNITGIGDTQVQKIIDAKGYTDLGDFFQAALSGDDCFVCPGIGETLSTKLVEGLRFLEDDMLKTASNLTFVEPEKQLSTGSLNGASFCFTGAASRPRKELQQMVRDNGGIVFEGVKKGLTYLVMADPNSTSNKAVAARKQGVKLISEEDFVNMCK